MTKSRIAAVVVVLLGLSALRIAAAAPSCAASCVARMASCRAARCADLSRKACRDRCRAVTSCRAGGARTRTLANVVTRCRVAGGEWTVEQRLEIQRGDCPPIKVVEFVAPGTAPNTLGLCDLYGRIRNGRVAVTVGPLQRLGMSPDGETILYEISTANTVPLFGAPRFEVPEAQQGIFAVQVDGSGVRRVGPTSRDKPYKGPIVPYAYDPGFNLVAAPFFNFSPNGRLVVFSDRGPGSDGTEAGQLVVMDVLNGERTQVTAFSAATQSPPVGADVWGFFVDDETISGATNRVASDGMTSAEDPFLVRRDERIVRFFNPAPPIPGAHVIDNFQVSGRSGNVVTVELSGMATEPDPAAVREVFFRDGDDVLQLTTLGRSDTAGGSPTRDGQRVIFIASANPFETNPSHNCQLFSIGRLGAGLRQLTRFAPGTPSDDGCARNPLPPACITGGNLVTVDPVTGSVVFDGTCDPFGLAPISSQQFAMRPDGSGLRQLTNYDGLREGPDGTYFVELPGPTAYSARDSSVGRGGRTGPR